MSISESNDAPADVRSADKPLNRRGSSDGFMVEIATGGTLVNAGRIKMENRIRRKERKV